MGAGVTIDARQQHRGIRAKRGPGGRRQTGAITVDSSRDDRNGSGHAAHLRKIGRTVIASHARVAVERRVERLDALRHESCISEKWSETFDRIVRNVDEHETEQSSDILTLAEVAICRPKERKHYGLDQCHLCR
uniref:hypothetical protein n=1 Tax=uncultured Sphingomonas sp. TaxID=158754 RepID=UPI0035CC1B06